ncbi:peptidoglycan-binding protein LysM [Hellea sp.]|nr:peptidoglycan-binding protein LysM [Hellea sp.]
MFGLIPFVSSAGKKIKDLFTGKDGDEKLKKEVIDYGLDTNGIDIVVNDDGTVSIKGEAATQEMKEKVILAVGNVEGVKGVYDEAKVKGGGTVSRFHTVVSGDTLSAIAKTYYGDYKKFPVIFEANRPMLSDPDKIYPGQNLRIPDLGADQMVA